MALIKLKNNYYSRLLIILLTFLLTGIPDTIFGAALVPGFYGSTSTDITAPSINAMPSLKNIVQGVSSLKYSSDSQLVVHQDESSAIIEWDSFNIGNNAWVHFDQQGKGYWRALNRIYDQDPSLIYGRLTADGHVYLINQNGMFFSPNSRINVGSLAASSLNMANDDFLAGTLSFVRENYIDPGESFDNAGVVSNHGTITADDSGSVFLIGTHVENNGEISAYLGWAALAAGEKADFYQEEKKEIVYNIVSVQDGGDVHNYTEGVITADMGQAGMYGNTVTQEGIIRSVTAVRKSGRIELMATEKVVIGENSVTATPISASEEEVHESFPFGGGEIIISGLDDDNPLSRIEHYGIIAAPAGDINMNAEERIYFGGESIIDVSGLWVEMSVSEKTLEVQLNSVELRDDYGQKDGILKGETITISALEGSSIGDISDYLSAEERTAREMALQGGIITLDAGSGDIILREGGLLDVSGGGIEYTGGVIETTKLLSINNVVYDISEAPEWETYSKILGEFEKVNERYGIIEEYSGLYYGGAAPLIHYADGFTEGSEAGTINLIGSSMVLDGVIDGSVTQGKYQIYHSSEVSEYLKNTYDKMGLSVPTAGTLNIGEEGGLTYYDVDPVLKDVVIDSSVAVLPDGFSPDDPFPEDRGGKSYISSGLINNAGLNTLSIHSRIGLSIEEDAEISLSAGGSFEGWARRIMHAGEISVPGGEVELKLKSNITTAMKNSEGEDNPEYVSSEILGHERIYLAPGSSISVAGEQIDNSMYGTEADYEYETGLLKGGSISIADETLNGEGVIIREDASIDVSGGYEIDDTGAISGGDAGSLSIQGATVILDGNLMGYSVPGMDGGEISVHAGSVSVLPDWESSVESAVDVEGNIPEELQNRFIMDDNLFDDTGFTGIDLIAKDKVEISSGSVLRPSLLKFYKPEEAGALENYGSPSSIRNESNSDLLLVRATTEYLGDSSIDIRAGQDFEEDVVWEGDTSGIVDIQAGAEVEVFPGGSIGVEGINIKSAGALNAPGGVIQMDAIEITLLSGSIISAKGYTIRKSESLTKDLSVGFSTVDGGNITLNGDELIIESGAVIDVSGSNAVTNYTWDEDGSITTVQTASAPGSVTLSFADDPVIEGELKAEAGLPGINGGALTLRKTDESNPLNISGEDISSYMSKGFDSLTMIGPGGISFTDSTDLNVGRDLTIDAPVISAAQGSEISITSPWITLKNTYNYYEGLYQGEEGDSRLILEGDLIDIEGYITLSSLQKAELIAEKDIRLSDFYYTRTRSGRWGGLDQTGELLLQADRIYPETLTSFIIKSSGDLTILDNGEASSSSLYSAGGSLEIEAANIYNYGDIYVPLGDITLTATAEDGMVYLGEGSSLITYTDADIKYGLMDDEGIFWGLPDKTGSLDKDSPVESAPSGSVNIEAENVITAKGSEIDVSGGGSVFAYRFLSGIEGTDNPLESDNQYIILPDNSVYSPGETIIIGENSVLPAGEYYLLSEEYAFVEGAVVLADLGTDLNITEYRATEEGYTVISGKTSVAGTDLEGNEVRYYSIREAGDLLEEGYFEIAELEAGDGGSVSLKGSTTIIEGSISGKPLNENYRGGILELSGRDVVVTSGDNQDEYLLPEDFDPAKGLEDQIAEDFLDKLILSDASISDRGMDEVILGDEESTLSLTFEEGVNLELKNIELNAKDAITINENAVIAAISESGNGIVTFDSPEGSLSIAETAVIHASDNIELNIGAFDIRGQLQVDNSSLSIKSPVIYFISDDYGDRIEGVTYITESLWEFLSSAENIELGRGSEIVFKESFDLSVLSEIIVDASLISTTDSEISISSGSVTLTNSADAYENTPAGGSGNLSIQADEILLSEGSVSFEGFSEINLTSSGDLLMQGAGSVVTGDADLNMAGAGIISSTIHDDEGFRVMDYVVNAGMGTVKISSNGGAYGSSPVAGGSLEINADSILHGGVLNMPGGRIYLNATGSGSDRGIFLSEGALIYAAGGDYSPGGTVELVSGSGIVSLAQGSMIDVSAGLQGDAGAVEIVSPANAAIVEGDLKGTAQGGRGGSFSLDSARIDDISALTDILDEGGLNYKIGLRARQGDIILSASDEISAEKITISADGEDGQGSIDIYGSIDTSVAQEDARIDIYAAGDLTLYSGSSLISGLSDGEIMLSGMESVTFEQGADINAGGSGDNQGSVIFRSLRSDTDLDMTLKGSVSGADRVIVRSVKIYDDDDHDGVIDDEIDEWKDETALYMGDAAAMKEAVFSEMDVSDGTSLYFTPGIQVQSENDLTIDNEWKLTDWHYDVDDNGTYETAGSLVLRTASDLLVNKDITDAPTSKTLLWEDTGLITWDIGLSSGSDLKAADPMDTVISAESGDLKLNDETLVYTERGNLNISSGNDTLIGKVNANNIVAEYIGYNLGTYSGSINGEVRGSLIIDGGAIQSSKGAIDIKVKGDLILDKKDGYLGTIRSLGTASSGEWGDVYNYYEYEAGGPIYLDIAGELLGALSSNDPWDTVYQVYEIDPDAGTVDVSYEWGASYAGSYGYDVAQGIVAMAGGDVFVQAAGDVTAGIGIFGQGDLSVYSGGDLNGRFLVANGTGDLYAAGDFGKRTGMENQHLELFDAQVSLTAGGSIELGTILNPRLANDSFYSDESWYLGYTTDTAASLNAISGDVVLTGETMFYGGIGQEIRKTILPASLSIKSARDILVTSGSFIMAPSQDGQLLLSAGRDISGYYIYADKEQRGAIKMSDMDPDEVYGDRSDDLDMLGIRTLINSIMNYEHGASVPHKDDDNPVIIEAGRDIDNITLYLPKETHITAGRDITDIYYHGQNTDKGDISIISASGNISFSSDLLLDLNTGILHGGPGTLLVRAGDAIDLGTTEGIQLVGNQLNSYLSEDVNDLIVLSGVNSDITLVSLKGFFNEIREMGTAYSELLAEGNIDEAEDMVNKAREEVIDPLLKDTVSGTGNIDMVESQINITGGPGGVYMLATGDINVGKTTFTESGSAGSDSGIYTTAGGPVNIYSVGDLNVNESRVMTFAGGDITVWSDQGDINAGRGSKTSVNATESNAVYDSEKGWSIEFEAPAVGSGIRTLTFDPDGLEGPKTEPIPGDVYLFAPEGQIDAGEAGISGTNVILGATEILNAQNISFSQGSVGVPVSTTTVNLSTMAGVSSLTDTSAIAQEATSSITEDREEAMKEAMKALEEFIARWLNVEVIGFYE